DAERIDDAVFQSAEAHTRDMNAILDTFVERTTVRDASFELPTSGELQPGSENGTPRPTQGYQTISQGYPMFRGMDSFGLNREAYAKLTVREMDKLMAGVQSKDARWIMRRVFGAIFTNVSWTFKEPGRSDLTVRGLAVTGDGSIYLDFNGDLTTADHYTGQADAISNSANPYEANSAILRTHPANTGVIVSYIPPGLMATTAALEGFYPYQPNDGLVDFGGLVDVAAANVGAFQRFGNEVMGVVGDNVIVVSRRLPAGYVVSVVDTDEAPLVMREEPEAELQGLQAVPMVVDSNFRKFDFYRKAGFAVRNPIAIAVREISDATYDIPSGYDLRTLQG
ncbi:MAG TPA: hypothetical protein VEA63_04725, partial [Opitutus sp.]|nr:hypothetical protein [Opitutus sp.]